MALVLTNTTRKEILDNLVDGTLSGAGALSGAKVALYTDGPTPNPDMSYASFTVAGFTGYALSAAVTWGTSFLDSDGVPTIGGSEETFIMTDTVTPETIKGYLLVTGTSPDYVVVAAEEFTNPVSLSETGQGLLVAPMLQLSAEQFGAGFVES